MKFWRGVRRKRVVGEVWEMRDTDKKGSIERGNFARNG